MASPHSSSAAPSRSFDREDRTEDNQEEMSLFVQDLLDQMVRNRIDEFVGVASVHLC